jgi:hypothetical protein
MVLSFVQNDSEAVGEVVRIGDCVNQVDKCRRPDRINLLRIFQARRHGDFKLAGALLVQDDFFLLVEEVLQRDLFVLVRNAGKQ